MYTIRKGIVEVYIKNENSFLYNEKITAAMGQQF